MRLLLLLPLLLLAQATGAVQDDAVHLRSLAPAGGTLAVDADLTLELGTTGTAGSLHLERRTAIQDRREASGAVVRSFDKLSLRAEMPFVEHGHLFVGRGPLEGRTVRFTPGAAEDASPSSAWVASFADGDESDSAEAEWLEPLRVETGLPGLVPGRSVELGATYTIEPAVLADVLALGGGYSYEGDPKDGAYPFRVTGARGEPLVARLESVRAVGHEHVAAIRITGTVSALVAFPGPGPLWRIGFASDDSVPRRARLELEVRAELEWWIEAGRADSLRLEAEFEIAEELTRIGTICEDTGLLRPDREIPFDPDQHLLHSKDPEKAPQDGTLKLRLEVDC